MDLLIGQPKDLYYFMRNASGFPVPGMNNQTVHLCKQGGVPYVAAATPVEVWDGVNASTKIGLYKLPGSATDTSRSPVMASSAPTPTPCISTDRFMRRTPGTW